MSASPMARKVTDCQAIPTKRVFIKDASELPSDYSSTPGGTLYSTTPGGTRIVYDKSHLLNLRNSPISKTPPNFEIPNTILKGSPPQFKITKARSNKRSIIKNQIAVPPKESVKIDDSEDQFAIDL